MTDQKPETCPDCGRTVGPNHGGCWKLIGVDGAVACLYETIDRLCVENKSLRSELATAQAELANASKVIDAAFRWQNACGDNELITEYQLIDELQRYEAALPKAPRESPPEPPLQQGDE